MRTKLPQIRFNPHTGEFDYYYPMEIEDSADREYAMLYGLEIGKAKVGYRVFEAIFVPCKEFYIDSKGETVYLDTPSDIQHRRYCELLKDELTAQDAARQDGRCPVPDGHGGIKRCPRCEPNPDYVPGGNEAKTRLVKCEGCPNEPYRQAHSVVPFSTFDHEGEDGELVSYEFGSDRNPFESDIYVHVCNEFLRFVHEHNPRVTDLAALLMLEYSRSDAARGLGIPISTAGGQKGKVEELYTEFRDNSIFLS